jgi:hypothetical protein
MPRPDARRFVYFYEKLMVTWQTESAHADRRIPPPIAQFVDCQKQNHVFEDIAVISFNDTASVSGLEEPRPLRVRWAPLFIK